MKKILSVLKKKNDEVDIMFLSGEILHLHSETYTDYYLYENKEISDEEFLEIKEKEELYQDKVYLIRILNNKNYSTKQIKEKLIKKRRNQNQINYLVGYLQSINLLNDEIFYQELISSLEYKGYGILRIQDNLKTNGLEYDYISSYENELEKAYLILPSLIKKYQNYNFVKMKESIINSLTSLGYEKEVIFTVIKSLKEEEFTSYEIEKLKKDYLKLTFKLTEEEKKSQASKIINKLKMKGYHYHDIINVIDQGEDL